MSGVLEGNEGQGVNDLCAWPELVACGASVHVLSQTHKHVYTGEAQWRVNHRCTWKRNAYTKAQRNPKEWFIQNYNISTHLQYAREINKRLPLHNTLVHRLTHRQVWLWKGHGVFILSTQKRLLDINQKRHLSQPIKGKVWLYRPKKKKKKCAGGGELLNYGVAGSH